MTGTPVVREPRARNIALIAHDNKKGELLEWARFNRELLAQHHLYATGTTGHLVQQELGLEVHKFYSGPLGGDQQIGARIAEGGIDCLIFFWDPLEPQPHDTDVKALLRISVVWNVPVACNRASADFIISSPLVSARYVRLVPDYARRDADGKMAVAAQPTDVDVHAAAEASPVAAWRAPIRGHVN